MVVLASDAGAVHANPPLHPARLDSRPIPSYSFLLQILYYHPCTPLRPIIHESFHAPSYLPLEDALVYQGPHLSLPLLFFSVRALASAIFSVDCCSDRFKQLSQVDRLTLEGRRGSSADFVALTDLPVTHRPPPIINPPPPSDFLIACCSISSEY